METNELDSLLVEQREEIMAAKMSFSDLDFAFDLQMEEAIAASRAIHSSSELPQSHAVDKPVRVGREDGIDPVALLLEDLKRVEQEHRDREKCGAVMEAYRRELDRRIHDQNFAREIMRVPESDWRKYGDNYEKPYVVGSSSSSSAASSSKQECFKLYFKGLVSEERIGDTRVAVGGIGVAICDPTDNLLWEVKKALQNGESKSPEVAELEGLIHGLDEALSLGLQRISFLCDDFMVHQYITGKIEARQSTLATLLSQVALLQRKFEHCQPTLVARNNIKFVFKLARDAIVSQIKWPTESQKGKRFMETCVICFEGIDVDKMFAVDGCYHRFCFSCMKQHVEVKVLNGTTAKCPSAGCQSEVKIDSCAKFLDPKLVDIMSQRLKEASIAASDKAYCPYPKCSALMSKRELLEFTRPFFVGADRSGARKCMKCNFFFCINCKVPWHYNMTCTEYSRSNPTGDMAVKTLASKRLWRQCAKCEQMIELAWGCYHITCRCGYEFCYTCGAEWKNKKATCKCPIWDERNIIHGNRNQGRR